MDSNEGINEMFFFKDIAIRAMQLSWNATGRNIAWSLLHSPLTLFLLTSIMKINNEDLFIPMRHSVRLGAAGYHRDFKCHKIDNPDCHKKAKACLILYDSHAWLTYSHLKSTIKMQWHDLSLHAAGKVRAHSLFFSLAQEQVGVEFCACRTDGLHRGINLQGRVMKITSIYHLLKNISVLQAHASLPISKRRSRLGYFSA